MSYTIEFSSHGERDFRKLSRQAQERILPILHVLAKNPRPVGAKKLKDMDYWRVRINDYRLIYEICDNVKRILLLRAENT